MLAPTLIVHELTIELVPLLSIALTANNPRTHSAKQIKQIAASICEFGFTNPILVDEKDAIIAGHGRYAAAKLIGIDQVPVIRLSGLSEAQKRALRVADNKIAENAGWDLEILAAEIEFLTSVEFDMSATGFEVAELDFIVERAQGTRSDPAADATPEIDPTRPLISKTGDLWRLGSHRLLCGDATSAQAMARLMEGAQARMVFTDPPYNVRIDGHVGGLGAIHHAEFLMASGEMTPAEFTTFLTAALNGLKGASVDGAIHFVSMDWRHCGELLVAGAAAALELKNICVWNKTNAGMGTFYRSQHEFIFVFKHGTAPHVNNFELGQHGRYRTNVWNYAGVNVLGRDRMDELRMHPTVKPVALVADAIKDCSKRRDIILDSFAGSGTTLIAAQKTGRRAYALELDPRYVDTAIHRWEEYTGESAVHAETGQSFAKLTAERAAAATPIGTKGAPTEDSP